MVTLTIDRALEDPVYEQMAGQIRQLVASGTLAPGMALPPVRQLASDLGVNLNTVARAYQLLKAEGFLVTRDRAGVSVAAPAERVEDAVQEKLLDQLRATIARLRQAGLAPDELLELVRCEVLAMSSGNQEKQDD